MHRERGAGKGYDFLCQVPSPRLARILYVLSFEITSGGVARAVNKDDYVKARIAAGLRGGITVDLKELAEKLANEDNND